MSGLRRELGLRDLVLFNIAAVAGIRWLAAAAHAGPGSITLWVLAAVAFFVPSALAVSALSRRFPEHGGIYIWTRESFGDWHGFLCGWCYWLSNFFFLPSLLLAGVGMASLALGFAEDRAWAMTLAMVVLWASLVTNLVGIRVGKWTENIGGFATYVAGILLIAAAAIAATKSGFSVPFSLIPDASLEKLNLWSQIAFAFGGLELGAIMGGEIHDPRRTVPRAAWISGIAVAAFYILGTLSFLVFLPPDQVNVVTGLVQVASVAEKSLGVPYLGIAVAVLVLVGLAGQIGAWAGGTARVPFVLGMDRYLPAAFARLHPRWQTPYLAILMQGAACTFFLLAAQAGESFRAGYQILVDLTVISYFLPFLYLFSAAWKIGQRATAASGIAVTLVAVGLAFVPLAGVGSFWLFETKLLGGTALLIGSGYLCFRRYHSAKG